MGKEKKYIEQCKGNNQGHLQNHATHVGPEKN